MSPIFSLIISVIALGGLSIGLNRIGYKKLSGILLIIDIGIITAYFLGKSAFSLVYSIIGEFVNLALSNLVSTFLIVVIGLIVTFIIWKNKKEGVKRK